MQHIVSSVGRGEDTEEHRVQLCSSCGEFLVITRKNGQFVKFTFKIVSREQVESAGRFRKNLEYEYDYLREENKDTESLDEDTDS